MLRIWERAWQKWPGEGKRMGTRIPAALGMMLLAFAPIMPAAAQDAPARGAAGMHRFLGLGAVPDPAAAARGRPLYGANCGGCHGIDARGGNGGPNLLYIPAVISDHEGDDTGAAIAGGKGRMPGFAGKLSAAEIRDIATYLDELVEEVANRGTYAFGNILVGDAGAGKAVFARTCAGCHSAAGDLKGVAAKFQTPAELQIGWVAPRGPAPTVTVIRRGGAPIRGELERKTDFAVTLVEAGGQSRTIPLDADTTVGIDDKMAAHRSLAYRLSDDEMHDITAYLETLR